MEHNDDLPIKLPPNAGLADIQRYVHDLEAMHGWLDIDLVHNCFLMGEEVGELFKAIRKYNRYYDQASDKEESPAAALEQVGDEIVDVLNYLCAIANRLEINLEEAFVRKNSRNQRRKWKSA